MTLLMEAGFNAIHQNVGIPAQWVSYIYTNYNIYTIIIIL